MMARETFPTVLYALLLQDFPESLVLSLAVFSLLNLRLWDRRVLYLALILTVGNLVRLLPIANGMHTVLLTILVVAVTRYLTGAKVSRIFFAVLLCGLIIGGMELLYAVPLMNYTGIPYERVWANPVLRGAFSLPYEVVLLLLALGKNYYNRKKGLLPS
jgi:hypothetical protein